MFKLMYCQDNVAGPTQVFDPKELTGTSFVRMIESEEEEEEEEAMTINKRLKVSKHNPVGKHHDI